MIARVFAAAVAGAELEARIVEHLRAQGPSLVWDLSRTFRLPISGLEALLRSLRLRGLVESRQVGSPPVLRWFAAGGDDGPGRAA